MFSGNPEHLAILQRGVDDWNRWRNSSRKVLKSQSSSGATAFTEVAVDLVGMDLSGWNIPGVDLHHAHLRDANLSGANLAGADLRQANFESADLSGTNLDNADLSNANLRNADLRDAILRKANLHLATLRGVEFSRANLTEANLSTQDLRNAQLSNANLSGADLTGTNLEAANLSGARCINTTFIRAAFVNTNMENADLTGARIYGIAAWDVKLTGAVQRDLIITPETDPSTITVDDLEVGQFIYLLLHNNRLRNVIDTITAKVVLILGRFSSERKPVLDAVREELRKRDYLPIVFDFEKPSNRDLTETVSTLAHMARFVIADLTDARSLPQELSTIAPHLPSVPVQPILLTSDREWGMYEHFPRYPWVLPLALYETQRELLANLAERVIEPPERWLTAAAER